MVKLAKNNLISLRIHGKKITSDKFSDSIYNFYGFINEVASEVFGVKNPIKWIVSVGKGSIDLLNKPELTKDLDIKKQDKVFSEIQIGIPILEKESKYPSSFNDKAMEHLKKLALLPNIQNGVEKVDIIVNDEKHILTKHIAANVESLLYAYPEAMSSITGRLSTLTEKRGLRIFVYDDRTGKSVDCIIDKEFLKDAIDAFGKRVYVYGTVSYYSNGRPKSIEVKKITKFKDGNELPHIFKTSGILKGA